RIYRYDTQTSALDLVSRNSDGAPLTQDATQPSISADGSHVAFVTAEAAVPTDTTAGPDVYDRNITSGVTGLISCPTAPPCSGVGDAAKPSMAGDTSGVAFQTRAPLVAGDTDGNFDVYVRKGGGITAISVDDNEAFFSGDATDASVNFDGTRVAFVTAVDVV